MALLTQTTIPTDFGSGGAHLAPNGASGTPSLYDLLKEHHDSLATLDAAISAGGGAATWKAPVVVATTANGTLATAFANGQTVDGVSLTTGMRILLKNQTTGSQNGIYTVNASGAPTRATDAVSGSDFVGAAVVVEQGTLNHDTSWLCTNDTVTVGSTSITFSTFGGSTSTCPLTVVEHKVIGVETNSLVFNSGLNGDTDGIYELFVRGIAGSDASGGASTAIARFNNDSAANRYIGIFHREYGVPTNAFSDFGSVGTSAVTNITGGPGDAWWMRAYIYPKTGTQRIIEGSYGNFAPSGSPNNNGFGSFSYGWVDTVTILSEIDLSCTQKIYGVGTEATLWKRATS